MTDNGHRGELAAALAKAQATFPKVVKDRVARINSARGQYEYRYADLASIIEAIRKPLADNGLAVTQLMEEYEGRLILRTELLHVGGASLVSTMGLSRHDRPQELGSEITYMRRYALSSLVGIASEDDDDGAAAQQSESRESGGRRRFLPRHGPPVTPEGIAQAGTDRPVQDPDSPEIRAEADAAFAEPQKRAPRRVSPETILTGEQGVRQALLMQLDKLGRNRRLDEEAISRLWNEHCGAYKPETVPLDSLRALITAVQAVKVA